MSAIGITNNSANAQTVNVPITLGAAQTFNAAGGDLTLGQAITNGGNLVSFDGSSNTIVTGVISGSGGLAKNGFGTNILSGNNSYGGTTTLNAGSLVLNGNNNLPGAITINSGSNTLMTVNGGSLAGSSLTMNSANASLGFSQSAGTSAFSGNVTFCADNGNNADLMQITGGVLDASNLLSGRCNLVFSGGAPTSGQVTTEGIYVNAPATVNITNLLDVGGYNSSGNSSASMRMDGGSVNVGGTTRITLNNASRWSVLDIHGGTFTSADATGAGIQIGGGYAGASAELLIRAGTVNADTITFGDAATQTSGTNFLNLTGGTLYVGSGGIVSANPSPTYLVTNLLGTATVGALANWSSSLPMTLSGTTTFQAADGNSNPFSISLNGALSGAAVLNKTGGGALTLGAANTYSGNTVVYAGTLALGASGTIASPGIVLGTNTTFDVSQVGSFALNTGQTLSGSGTVTGAVTAASATIYPGSNSVTGTLAFLNGLTENGGVNNTFTLSGNPSGRIMISSTRPAG